MPETYGVTAPNGATLTVAPQPDGRPLVEINTDDGRATSVLLYLAAATATTLAEDIDRAVEAADRGDTTVRSSEPRLDVSGDTINVTPGPDDGTGPRVTIAANEDRGEEDGAACVAIEVPTDEAVDLAAAIRTAARSEKAQPETPEVGTEAPESVAVASLRTHRLIVAVANDGTTDVQSNMHPRDAAGALRQLADRYEKQAAEAAGQKPKGSCSECGSVPSAWCRGCATCPPGCALHGHTDACPEAAK